MVKNMDATTNLLAISEVAKLAGLSTEYLRRLDARLCPARIGNRRVYRRDLVDAWLAERAAVRAAKAAKP